MPRKEYNEKTSSRKGLGNSTSVAADMLRAFVERIERLEAEKAETAGGIKALSQQLREAEAAR